MNHQIITNDEIEYLLHQGAQAMKCVKWLLENCGNAHRENMRSVAEDANTHLSNLYYKIPAPIPEHK